MSELVLYNDEVFVVRGVLSGQECDECVWMAEQLGFGEAPITTFSGPVINKRVRNNARVMVDDVDLSASLWGRVAEHLPEKWRHTLGGQFGELGWYDAVGLNERLRIYRYEPGQYFAPHSDGCFRRRNGEYSMLTALFFLNDDFEGGRTRILEHDRAVDVVPEKGSVLFFHHPLLHEGEGVELGVKYILRSDVMYRITRRIRNS